MSMTYAELQTAVASYLARGNLTSQIPGFITRGENYLNAKLKLLAMESLETVTLATGLNFIDFGSMSTKVREVKQVFCAEGTGFREVVKVDPLKLASLKTTETRKPGYWNAESGEYIYFDAYADQDYTLRPLIVAGFDIATSTNWLSSNHEEAYLYASLAQAEPFIKNDARVALWKSLLTEAITDINAEDRARRGDQNNILIPEISQYLGIRRAYNINTDA